MLQLLDSCREGLLSGLLGGLAAILTPEICKAFLTFSFCTEFLGETPYASISKDFRVNPMQFKDFSHSFPVCHLTVSHTLEFWRKADLVANDAGNIRAAAEFRNLFCVEWFLGHSALPFSPD